MKTTYKIPYLSVILILMFNIGFISAQENVVLSAMKKEVDRNMSGLKINKLQPPFFISYTIAENQYLDVTASMGALQTSNEHTRRIGWPIVLVGNYNRNNLNFMSMMSYYAWFNPDEVCLENYPKNIATTIWRGLDSKYKFEAEISEVKHSILKQQVQKEEDLSLDDFEKKDAVKLILEPEKMKFEKTYWENFAKKASEVIRKYPEIINSSVNVYLRHTMMYYYNTEGTMTAVPTTYYKFHLKLNTLTNDGHELSDDLYIEHPAFEQMPDLKTYISKCETFTTDFLNLRKAPLIDESYSGPVLFEDMAVAEALQQQFFTKALITKRKLTTDSEIGRRMGNSSEVKGNDLESMTNKKIISRSLSIKSLSGSETYNGKKLDGYFPIDAEGVAPAKELTLVEDGVLRNMLNDRIPTKKNPKSNGHARFDYNLNSKIAPGNILFTSKDTYSKEELKKKLLAAAKEEDLDYAYILRRMRGDNVLSLYKIYVIDGREELVRGASLQDFNMKAFKRTLGASNQNFMYNTASFGAITTYVVPSALLFEELDITRNNNITFKPPYIVPKPELKK